MLSQDRLQQLYNAAKGNLNNVTSKPQFSQLTPSQQQQIINYFNQRNNNTSNQSNSSSSNQKTNNTNSSNISNTPPSQTNNNASRTQNNTQQQTSPSSSQTNNNASRSQNNVSQTPPTSSIFNATSIANDIFKVAKNLYGDRLIQELTKRGITNPTQQDAVINEYKRLRSDALQSYLRTKGRLEGQNLEREMMLYFGANNLNDPSLRKVLDEEISKYTSWRNSNLNKPTNTQQQNNTSQSQTAFNATNIANDIFKTAQNLYGNRLIQEITKRGITNATQIDAIANEYKKLRSNALQQYLQNKGYLQGQAIEKEIMNFLRISDLTDPNARKVLDEEIPKYVSWRDSTFKTTNASTQTLQQSTPKSTPTQGLMQTVKQTPKDNTNIRANETLNKLQERMPDMANAIEIAKSAINEIQNMKNMINEFKQGNYEYIREAIQNTNLLSEEQKAEALAKLDELKQKIINYEKQLNLNANKYLKALRDSIKYRLGGYSKALEARAARGQVGEGMRHATTLEMMGNIESAITDLLGRDLEIRKNIEDSIMAYTQDLSNKYLNVLKEYDDRYYNDFQKWLNQFLEERRNLEDKIASYSKMQTDFLATFIEPILQDVASQRTMQRNMQLYNYELQKQKELDEYKKQAELQIQKALTELGQKTQNQIAQQTPKMTQPQIQQTSSGSSQLSNNISGAKIPMQKNTGTPQNNTSGVKLPTITIPQSIKNLQDIVKQFFIK